MSKLLKDDQLHLSVSSMESFKSCPRKFYHGKVEAIQPKAALAGDSPLLVGTAVHSMLEQLYATGDGMNGVDLTALNANGLEKAQAALGAYATYAGMYDNFKIISLEEKFEVPLENDEGAKILLRGRIDGKAEYADGSRFIIEFKTAAKTWSRVKKELSEQGILYEMASQDADGVPYTGTLWNWIRLTQRSAFRGGPKYWYGEVDREFYSANDSARAEVFQNAVDVAVSIYRMLEQGKPSAFYRVPGDQCMWCDFSMLCKAAYQGSDVEWLKEEYYEPVPEEVKNGSNEVEAV